MDEKNNGKDHNIVKKQDGRRNQFVERDIIKQYKGERDHSRVEERKWLIMGRQWNCICR